jgi:hypothetical protein
MLLLTLAAVFDGTGKLREKYYNEKNLSNEYIIVFIQGDRVETLRQLKVL